jgi:hypothetical protein
MSFLTRCTAVSMSLPLSMTLALLSTVAACGGGSDGGTTPVASNPQPPVQPAPTTPTGPQTPPTQPTDPAPVPPPPELVLQPGYTQIAASIGFSRPNWPAWRHAGTAAVDGVGCAPNENYHIHALLSVYRDGQRLLIPDSIGRGSGCSYEMHTHESSGVLHIETDVPKVFTLGQFVALWGQNLGATSALGLSGSARYYVIEKEAITPVTTDPAAIVLSAHKEIVIIVGTPPASLPRYDWASTGL